MAEPTEPTATPSTPRPGLASRRAALAIAVPPDPRSGATVGADAPASPAYLPALDGVRALAVAAVVAYHLGRLRGGFLGVDVFFVVSGFLITRLLLAEHAATGRVALRAFWTRRFRRLLPALLVVLVVVAIGSKAWLPAWRLTSIRDDCLAALAYVANWRFILSGQSYFTSGIAPSPVRHTWSLAIEEQYYLVWPLVVAGAVAIAGRWPARRVVATVAALGAAASASWMAVAAGQGRDLSRIYFGTDTRAFALFVGAWLATVRLPAPSSDRTDGSTGDGTDDRNRWPWAAAGFVAVGFVAVAVVRASTEDVAFYRGGFQAVAVLAAVLVAALATGVGPFARALAVRPLVWVGRRSYGIYLWSWPVQVFASEGFELDGVALDAAVVVLAVGLAALSHWLVEEPVRTGRRPARFGGRGDRARDPRRPTASRRLRPAVSFGAIGAVIAVVAAVAIGAPAAPDFTKVSDAEANAAALRPSDDVPTSTAATTTIPIDEGPPGPLSEARTFVVDPTAQVDPATIHDRPLKVLLVGDSVGWSLGFRVEDIPDGIDLSDRALLGCGLLPQDAKFIVGGRDPEQYPVTCARQEEVEQYGLDWGPDVVLLWFGAWEVYDQEIGGTRYDVGTRAFATVLETKIQARVNRYRSLGLPTLLASVPCFGPNAARLGKERHDQDRIDWVNARIRAVAKRNRGWVRVIDPTGTLCEPDGTARTATDDGQDLRPDGAHFVADTASWFWNEWLAGQIGAALDVAPPSSATTTTAATTTTTTTTSTDTADPTSAGDLGG